MRSLFARSPQSQLSRLEKPPERSKQVFFIALFTAALIFLPFVVYDHGYFIYYGDFNVQQISFYRMIHDSIRSGNIGWSWTTDLGANLIGSYSFYLLGSPFFWVTLLFPSAAIPYLMAPLLVLKFALAAFTAYWYLRRFLRPNYAALGGLLYAFSGFSIYNIFFNHFHEAIIYFPLMLLAMEMYMKDGKRGCFAAAVFLSALSNYYFFIGQSIFLVIYWVVRAMSGDWHVKFSKFAGILFEAVVGTAMAAVLLLPSYYAVIQNNRTDNLLTGWDALIYSKPQRFFDILHSFFFPQDIPARAAFFPDSDNKWASMSAWLPIFGCTGAIAYYQSRRSNDWVRRLLLVCFVMALIPGLNASFELFNSMYYARWFYMFVLLLVLATMKTFDESETIPVSWKRAFGWSAGITAAFALFVGFMPSSFKPDAKTGKIVFGLYNHEYAELFWIAVILAAASLVLGALVVSLHRRERPLFFRWSIGTTVCFVLIFGWYSIGVGKGQSNFSSDYVVTKAIRGADKLSLPNLGEARIDFNDGMDNMGMFWEIPTIQAFHSIVPGSIMDFYPTVGVERSVGSRPDTTHFALRGLLSVRYLFDYNNDDNAQYKEESDYFAQTDADGVTTYKMPGWTYYGEQNGFSVYENQYYIPYGFTYDYYLTRTQYNNLAKNQREQSLLKAIVLEDDDAEKYGDYLKSFEISGAFGDAEYTEDAYLQDCVERRETAASSFSHDNSGFSATISLPKDNLVFFSVPYEKGWSATVNGQPAEIVKANVGFMAVLCPKGENVSIRFTYKTPGLGAGALISLGALLVLLLYLGGIFLFRRRHPLPGLPPEKVPIPPIGEAAPENGQPEDGASPPSFDLYRYYPGSPPEPPAPGDARDEQPPEPPDNPNDSEAPQ